MTAFIPTHFATRPYQVLSPVPRGGLKAPLIRVYRSGGPDCLTETMSISPICDPHSATIAELTGPNPMNGTVIDMSASDTAKSETLNQIKPPSKEMMRMGSDMGELHTNQKGVAK
jgi:hypothetical protein